MQFTRILGAVIPQVFDSMRYGNGIKGGRWLMPKLRAACPWIIEIKGHLDRCFGGVRLNDVGLRFWQRQSTEPAQRGHGPRGTSSSSDFVNRPWRGELDEGGAE
jgi:hypothetical protein